MWRDPKHVAHTRFQQNGISLFTLLLDCFSFTVLMVAAISPHPSKYYSSTDGPGNAKFFEHTGKDMAAHNLQAREEGKRLPLPRGWAGQVWN